MIQKEHLKKPHVRRVWFISDTHLGVRNNSAEWIDLIREYFFQWFFPLVDKHYQPGDVLIHLGDYFDSRQSINLKVLDLGTEIAEEFSKRFPDGVFIILGNHDVWGRTSNDVNSLRSFKWIPHLQVFEEPVSVQFGNRSFFLMPWRKDHQAETETLEKCHPHDVLCCHSDVQGFNFNRFTRIENGPEEVDFQKFKSVYSGHIHYTQKKNNIRMIGCPYQLTRSDIDNQKSIVLLDLQTMEETIFPNNYSPKFQRILFSEILEMTPGDLEEKVRNNFVDVLIDPSLAIRAPLSILTDSISSPRSLKFHPVDDKSNPLYLERVLESETQNFNVLDFISEYVRQLPNDDTTKEKIKKSLFSLHNIVTSSVVNNRSL